MERQNGNGEDEPAEEANDNAPLSVRARRELAAIADRLEALRAELDEAAMPEEETAEY